MPRSRGNTQWFSSLVTGLITAPSAKPNTERTTANCAIVWQKAVPATATHQIR